MKKIYYIYLLILSVFSFKPLAAQTQDKYTIERDSLKAELNQASSSLEKVKLANDLAYWYIKTAQSGAEKYIDVAHRLLTNININNEEGYTESEINYEKCRTTLYRSYEEFTMRDLYACYESSLELDSIATLELSRSDTEKTKQYIYWQIESMQNRAYADFAWGYAEEAFDILNKSLARAKDIGCDEWEVKSYKKMGEMYSFLGNHSHSIEAYKEAIQKMEKTVLPALEANAYVALGNQYAYVKNIKEASTAYTKSIEKFESLGNVKGIAAAYFNMAQTYHQAKDYEYATRYAKKSMEYYRLASSPKDVADCLDILTSSVYQKGDYTAVIDYALEALKIRTETNDRIGSLISNDLLIFAYLSTARHLNEFSEGDYYIYQAYLFSHKVALSSFPNLTHLKSFSLLTAYFEADSLKTNIRRFINADDSLSLFQTGLVHTSKSRQALERKLIKFENTSQKHTIELQKARIQSSRMRFWITLLSASIVLVLTVSVYLSSRKQKRTNDILKQRNVQIIEQQKAINKQVEETKSLMDFKERMTNMIIHDLKTPLNGIMSAEFIDDEVLKNEIIRHSASEMMNLVQNVLDYYKSQETGMTVKPKMISLSTVIEKETQNIRFILDEKSLKLRYEDNNLPKFKVDPQLFRRVISNIFSNAAKYSPQKGIITVMAKVENNTDIRIFISNQGPSIPDSQTNLIFQPFGQAGGGKDLGKASSTGLGLTFCQMAIEAHGGQIGVTPNMEQGAEFWILLPNCLA
ncbi:MAG: ATP-binding protein [Mangrovibacterium sp.]